jgi:hypothetical protein
MLIPGLFLVADSVRDKLVVHQIRPSGILQPHFLSVRTFNAALTQTGAKAFDPLYHGIPGTHHGGQYPVRCAGISLIVGPKSCIVSPFPPILTLPYFVSSATLLLMVSASLRATISHGERNCRCLYCVDRSVG